MLATAGTNGVMFHEITLGTFTEVGRIDTMKTVDAVAFSPDSKQVYIAREREPLIKGGAEGTEKLVDPFFVSVIIASASPGSLARKCLSIVLKSVNSTFLGSTRINFTCDGCFL